MMDDCGLKKSVQERARVAEAFCEKHQLITDKDREENRWFPETLMTLCINRMEVFQHPNPELSQVLMSDGEQTAEEWLNTQPRDRKKLLGEAIVLCLKRGVCLDNLNIRQAVREIGAE